MSVAKTLADQQVGLVIWFHRKKKYRFIKIDRMGEEVYVHRISIKTFCRNFRLLAMWCDHLHTGPRKLETILWWQIVGHSGGLHVLLVYIWSPKAMSHESADLRGLFRLNVKNKNRLQQNEKINKHTHRCSSTAATSDVLRCLLCLLPVLHNWSDSRDNAHTIWKIKDILVKGINHAYQSIHILYAVNSLWIDLPTRTVRVFAPSK